MNYEQLYNITLATHERVKELRAILQQEDMTTFSADMFQELTDYLMHLYSVFMLLADLLDELRSQE